MFIHFNGTEIKLPDFLIIGAPKTATTSLYYYLEQHPKVFMSSLKELKFFYLMGLPIHEIPEWMIKEKVTVLTLDAYIAYFKPAGKDQIMGEASTQYMYNYRRTIKNIKEIYGKRYKDLKLISLLRNPAERAWSHYLMHVRDGNEHLDFRDAIKPGIIAGRLANRFDHGFDYIGGGMYYEQLLAYINEFPHIKIFLYDELRNNTMGVVKDMYEFLGVNNGFTPCIETKYNVSGLIKSRLADRLVAKPNPLKSVLKYFIPYNARRRIKFKVFEKVTQKQKMPEDIKKFLIDSYRSDILKLEKLINKDLSLWLRE